MLTSLKKLLPRRLKKLRLDSQVEAAEVCETAKGIIKDFFKHKVFFNFNCRFKNGILKIESDSPIYLNELHLNKQDIKERINKKLNKRIVKKIIF